MIFDSYRRRRDFRQKRHQQRENNLGGCSHSVDRTPSIPFRLQLRLPWTKAALFCPILRTCLWKYFILGAVIAVSQIAVAGAKNRQPLISQYLCLSLLERLSQEFSEKSRAYRSGLRSVGQRSSINCGYLCRL